MGTSGLLRKAGRGNWYLRIYDPRTRREYRESAHTADERIARQRLAEAERLVTLGAYVPPVERRSHLQRVEISLHTAIAEFVSTMVTNRASQADIDTTAYLLFNFFLEFFEAVDLRAGQHLAPDELPKCRLRIARYRKTAPEDVEQLLSPHPSDRAARLITTQIVEAYKTHRLDVADADETTVNNELKMLRMFGRWLVRRAMLEEDPFDGVRDVKDDGPGAGRTLRLGEYGALALDRGLQEWIVVTGVHGLRRGETDHLRPEDINIEEGYIDVRKRWSADGTLLWRPKFGKDRKVPMVEAAVPFLRALRDLPTDRLGHLLGVHDRRKASCAPWLHRVCRGM